MRNLKHKHLCWSCANVGKGVCAWDKCGKPVEGWVAKEHHFSTEPYVSYTITKCPLHEYDGECANCVRNTEGIKACLYDTCEYYNRRFEGACGYRQWIVENKNEILRDEYKNSSSDEDWRTKWVPFR